MKKLQGKKYVKPAVKVEKLDIYSLLVAEPT